MKLKTSELIGPALDWAVAKCVYGSKYGKLQVYKGILSGTEMLSQSWAPSTDWAQGGPIIEREQITTRFWLNEPFITAYLNQEDALWAEGDTPLIAAMRCYVASKLGDEIELPEELL